MTLSYSEYKSKRDINTWISFYYCKNWGLREAMREILQNQKDKIIELLGKDNYIVEALNDYEFDILKKGSEEIYGSIRYNKSLEVLSIENKGKLETFNLLLGGTTRNEKDHNSGIIGCFGEGLKIAALAFIRENKQISIINNNQVWRFTLKEDNNFIRNGSPEKCLCWRWEEYNNKENKDKVIIQIRNIKYDEWLKQIDNYLWLVSKVKNLALINTPYGDIILSPDFKDKIYSNGVFVMNSNQKLNYGFNIPLILDRDRNCVPNIEDCNNKIKSVISDILNNFTNYQKKLDDMNFNEIELFDKFPENILDMLDAINSHSSNLLSRFHYKLSTSGANFLWEVNKNKRRKTDKRFDTDNKDLLPQPTYIDLKYFLQEKHLSENFYEFFTVSSELANCLEKSVNYESIYTRFEKLVNATIETPSNNEEVSNTINSIIDQIKILRNNFSKNILFFKSFPNEETYYSMSGKYFFSSLLFSKPEKMKKFVVGRILDMLNIKIVDLLEKFNIIQK